MNETIAGLSGLTFDKVSEVTTSIPFIIALIFVWGIPLFIYLLWGALASARTSDGRKLKSKVISNANFWIGFLIFGILGASLYAFIIFPIWLMPFS